MINLDLNNKKVLKMLPNFRAYLEHSFHNSYFSREERVQDFQDAWEYYRSLKPEPLNGKKEVYVEPVLREVVDSITPSMLAVFCENQSQAVAFRPTSKLVTSEVTDAVNKAINDIFLRENDGYKQLNDAILEALVVGDSFGKVYLCDDEIVEPFEATEWLPIELLGLILEEFPDTDIEQFETRTREGVQQFKTDGEVELLKIETKVKFDYVPFGEVYVDPIATCIDDARYICHRTIHTKGELLDKYPDRHEEITAANVLTGLNESNTSNLKLETLRAHASKEDYYTSSVDEMEVSVYLYEHWVYSSLLDKDNKTKLYQVYTVDGEGTLILEVNEVDNRQCHPFIKGEVMPLPDSLWGISLYSLCRKDQDLLTRLNEQILTNGDVANHRRYTAVKGQYDRKSLLDNRVGGVVEVNAMGMIDVFPYHQLPQATNDLYNKVVENINQIKGNALGPELGASLNNVAASTVAMAVQNMEMQDKKFSKAFALSYVKPLFEKIYKLIKSDDVPLDGGDFIINGKTLPSRPEFVIDVNTANDNARIAGQHQNILQTINGLGDMASELTTPAHVYNMLSDIYKTMGVNPDKYLQNPEDKPEPTEFEQMVAEEMQRGQLEMQQIALNKERAEVRKMSADVVKTEVETMKLLQDVDRDKEKNATDYMKMTGNLELENEEMGLKVMGGVLDAQQKQQQLDQASAMAAIDTRQAQITGEPVNIMHYTTNKVG